MAKTKWATVTGQENLGNDVHRIHCRSDEPLQHISGNYVILRSSLQNPEKPSDVIKRAYSISSPPNQNDPLAFHFTIVDVGVMSAWLSGRSVGDRLEFSGPWGKKFRAQPDDSATTIHLFATGTGLSPIGAMALDRLYNDNRQVHLWWQTEAPYDQSTLDLFRKSKRFTVQVGTSVAADVPAQNDALYFFAGDGAIIQPLCQRLLAAGVAPDLLRTEYFFNKPPKTR